MRVDKTGGSPEQATSTSRLTPDVSRQADELLDAHMRDEDRDFYDAAERFVLFDARSPFFGLSPQTQRRVLDAMEQSATAATVGRLYELCGDPQFREASPERQREQIDSVVLRRSPHEPGQRGDDWVTAPVGGQRFLEVPEIDATADGIEVLDPGDRGEGVLRVQQALIDMGYANPVTVTPGTFDLETERAVRRFQRDAAIAVDGRVGRQTLAALATRAPPAGQALERSAEYDRLFADGRLDVTIAIGFNEERDSDGQLLHVRTIREVYRGLESDGFRSVSIDRIRGMDPAERRRLGLTEDRLDPNVAYYVRSDGHVDTVVRLIQPGSGNDGARARASFARALEQDEVVIYAGHARYGTGPDFDPIDSGSGNFVIDGHGNRDPERHGPPAGLRTAIGAEERTDLPELSSRPGYQLLIFNGCSTEEYLRNLRNRRAFDRDMSNTDVIATTMAMRVATLPSHILGFVSGVTARQSNNEMLGEQSRLEQNFLRQHPDTIHLVPAAAMAYSESGFLRNSGNRHVPAPAGTRSSAPQAPR